MSLAGARSNQGDEYQLRIALNWLIRALKDPTIDWVQGESRGVPNEAASITVDDIVVRFKDGHSEYVQSKKNQPDHRAWSLSDLNKELLKARDQLEVDATGEVSLYSRTPFGDLYQLVQTCALVPDHAAFNRDAGEKAASILDELSKMLGRTPEQTFLLTRRIGFGPAHTFEDWDRANLDALNVVVGRAELALLVLERYVASHQAGLRSSKFTISRLDLVAELEKNGLFLSGSKTEQQLRVSFSQASSIGRNWPREIDDQRIQRPETEQILGLVKQKVRSILVSDGPGSGKTCVLLDVAEKLEQSSDVALLFIKSDYFADALKEQDLADRGLPENITGSCLRLATSQHVVVLFDSLDVLSINRNHGALRLFLGLLDRLQKIENLTSVAACRSFDLKYDVHLRGRKWDNAVSLKPFDFDTVVAPFVLRWGIDPASLSPELRELIRVPQHLRLFRRIALTKRNVGRIGGATELYQSFIEEVIRDDPELGPQVVVRLEELAADLATQRRQVFPSVSLRLEIEVLQRLKSLEVLVEIEPGKLSFGHQAIAEAFLIQRAVASKQTLLQFVLGHVPLPFIRPAIRSFLFLLRRLDLVEFRAQVWAVLSHANVAYHIKRLIAESLAEVVPADSDWGLVRRISEHEPALFRQMFWQLKSESWFDFLLKHWVPFAKGLDVSGPLTLFVRNLEGWCNKRPQEVLELWHEAVVSKWIGANEVSMALDKFSHWSAESVEPLLKLLVSQHTSNDIFLGKALSKWVNSTNQGDELLWKFISQRVDLGRLKHFDFGRELECDPHHFESTSFLAARLRKSELFLSLVVNDLLKWCETELADRQSVNIYLSATSWEAHHSREDHRHVDELDILVQAVEAALRHHAKGNTDWWQANEPRLRAIPELGIRYLLLQGYRMNIDANVAGVEALLTDKAMLRSTLEYEVGLLMRDAYSSTSAEAQERNQQMLLALADEYKDEQGNVPEWAHAHVYNMLIMIPRIFRVPDTQRYLETWEDNFGTIRPSPRIHRYGGTVKMPVPGDTMLTLPNSNILRLLSHYGSPTPSELTFDEGMVGGQSEIERALGFASARDPERFLDFLAQMPDEIEQIYWSSVVGGAANYLRYRSKTLQPGEAWTPIGADVDEQLLAKRLIKLAEQKLIGGIPVTANELHGIARVVQACCEVLKDEQSAEWLTTLLFRLLHSDDPAVQESSDDGLEMLSLNSVRGIAAEAAMTLHSHLLEHALPTPLLLDRLLVLFAGDPVAAVRLPILSQLPVLIHKDPTFGWKLFRRIFQEPQLLLWSRAERVFYYQYKDHFDLVAPFLERISKEAAAEAGGTYGRIVGLSYLAGHISKVDFDRTMQTATESISEAVAQVFCANILDRQCKAICRGGLLDILRSSRTSKSILDRVDRIFEDEKKHSALDPELAITFLDAVIASKEKISCHGFVEWLERFAHQDPSEAAMLADKLATLMESNSEGMWMWRTESLVGVLLEILREADETNDQALVLRAVQIQDRFLRLNVRDVDKLLDHASKN